MKTLLIFIALFFHLAHAGQSDTKRVQVLCEYRLAAKTSNELLTQVQQSFLAQTYLPSAIVTGLSELAIRKLGLDPRSLSENTSNSVAQIKFDPEAIDPVTLSIHRVSLGEHPTFEMVAAQGFPDPLPGGLAGAFAHPRRTRPLA